MKKSQGFFARVGAAITHAFNPGASSLTDGGFVGSRTGRRSGGFGYSKQHVNSLVVSGGANLLARARFLTRENPYAISAQEDWVAHTVGTGIKPSWLGLPSVQRKGLMSAWADWTDQADHAGQTDFYGLQAMVAAAVFEAGECFVVARYDNASAFPLRLQLLEAEMLPYSKNEVLANGAQIKMGVEIDAEGKRLAYHFLKQHPGDNDAHGFGGDMTVRVEAEHVTHIFDAKRPGQLRGVTRIAGAITRLNQLDAYDDATLERAKSAAFYMGFIQRPAGSEDAASAPNFGGPTTDNGDGTATVSMQPGTVLELEPGDEMNMESGPDFPAGYGEFVKHQGLGISAAMGVPYIHVTGDVSAANFSSLRGGSMLYRRRVERFQHAVLVFQLCRWVADKWLRSAALAGGLPELRATGDLKPFLSIKWIAPAWTYVNPKDEVTADEIAVRAGFKARSDVIESYGDDPEATDQRIADDQNRLRGLGVELAPKPGAAAPTQPSPADTNGTGTN